MYCVRSFIGFLLYVLLNTVATIYMINILLLASGYNNIVIS